MDEDWILNANEGQVAVVAVGSDDDQPEGDEQEEDEEDFHNKDVHVFEDAELQTEEEKAFDDYRKQMAALLPPNLGMPANHAADDDVAP